MNTHKQNKAAKAAHSLPSSLKKSNHSGIYLDLLELGFSYAEIAKARGVSLAAVHVAVSRLRKAGRMPSRGEKPILVRQLRRVHELRSLGYSHKDIASILGIGVQVSMNYANKAKKKLQAIMG